jgi:mRNA-degrading endonuclease RelE of RelBE toxin-antitoxin system
MDPDRRTFIAPWELRVGELRVYYAVEEDPKPTVVIVAVGIKIRERLRIAGKDVVP